MFIKHRTGCLDLLYTVQHRVKPKYHVFGHIHEGEDVVVTAQAVVNPSPGRYPPCVVVTAQAVVNLSPGGYPRGVAVMAQAVVNPSSGGYPRVVNILFVLQISQKYKLVIIQYQTQNIHVYRDHMFEAIDDKKITAMVLIELN